MTTTLLDLPGHARRRLAAALEAGLLAPPFTAAAVRAALGSGVESESVAASLRELEAMGLSGPGCAALRIPRQAEH